MHPSVRLDPVESGHDRGLFVGEERHHDHVGFLTVKGAVSLEEDDLFSIHEAPGQEIGEEKAVEVFAAAGAVVCVSTACDLVMNMVQFPVKVDRQFELAGNLLITRTDFVKRFLEVLMLAAQIVATVQQVRHLVVSGKTAPGSRGNHVDAGRIAPDDVFDFTKLLCIGKGRAAKLGDNLFFL